MKKLIALLLALCLFLSGCTTWLDGNYYNVTPHKENIFQPDTDNMSASDYSGLVMALEQMIQFCTESGIIAVGQYDQSNLSQDMYRAVMYIQENNPIGAYAVDQIKYELGATAGQPAVAVNITYIHTMSDIRKIQTAADLDAVKNYIATSLDECASEAVMYINDFVLADFTQWIEDYAALRPDSVMETPGITVNLYPPSGVDRIIELKFHYQTSRDNLKNYQNRVEPIFEAASLYVSGDGSDMQKYAQLYAFLMERHDYKYQTSITPSYSLLIHGVGDSKAFATVYAAMCRNAELDCLTVSGTRNGEAWFWNLILIDGNYYHVDLLGCAENGAFRTFTDSQMTGYVWDYSAYSTQQPRAAAEQPTE